MRVEKEPGHLNLHTGRSLAQNTVPDVVLIKFDLLMMSKVLLETCRGKGKAVLLQAWEGRGFQEVKFPRFRDNSTGWW